MPQSGDCFDHLLFGLVRSTAFWTICLSGTAAAGGAKQGRTPGRPNAVITHTACHSGQGGAALATHTNPYVLQNAGVCLQGEYSDTRVPE